ncbi:PTS transporter subunit EIIC, partial [Vibrio cholerae]|nr:PTS transporter subunit EIIC [Vibrio cholerae]
GDQKIFMAQLKDGVELTAGTFTTGKYPFMMFGLPAAALAMYHEARPENKKLAAGILGSAALTSFLTGITEPLEFSFLFVAPVLFGIHAVFAGLS